MLVSILAALLVLQGGAQELVLCICGDGNVAIETTFAASCCSDGEVAKHEKTIKALNGDDCDGCIDITLTSDNQLDKILPIFCKITLPTPCVTTTAVLEPQTVSYRLFRPTNVLDPTVSQVTRTTILRV